MPPVPSYDEDLFADEALLEQYEHYRGLRSLGPVVWLERHGVWALPRYEEVRQALGDAETFVSGLGVGLNDFVNEGGRGTTLMSDGEAHQRQREIIGSPLTPRALSEMRPEVQALADSLVDSLVQRQSFDAIAELAEVIPRTWVPDLLGWPEDGRDQLLDWGSAAFDALGPLNVRAVEAGPRLIEMAAYAGSVAARGDLPENCMAAGILAAAARGDIEASQCPSLMIDYLAPSLDTTISALGSAVWLFAMHPGQWALVRNDPSLVKNAFNEVLRYESPISCFSRVTSTETELAGCRLAAGDRVLVMYASANRDERRFDRPDEFDITRESAGQLSFGYGPHLCAGMGLARLEGHAVITALAARIDRLELAPGASVRKVNNLIRGFASLPVTVHSD